ncbi:hypothetical protein ASG52_17950 [Methylobacterium sp. Leaf456]|uniref:TadE/TadG family type IV pilus assembly protein n=1 Tax=Methylobacterium sp. Leaf456 TaxID=1736382 RepID=UPI0006FD24A7|nr:hypothetical protein [Methylobacterium sp. Leaf456]KQT61112.1 hypothetical protein ASG52_17950 [Methylobacterium sp. Leaf456]
MFRRDEGGAVIVVVSLIIPALLIGLGGAIEASRAVSFRQQLASAVELSCKQGALYVNASKTKDTPTLVDGKPVFKSRSNEVEAIATRNFEAKNMSAAVRGKNMNPDDLHVHVEASATMPLVLAKVLRKETMSFSVAKDCSTITTAEGYNNTVSPSVVFRESFEGGHSISADTGTGWGVVGGYRNSNAWNGWTTQGAGVEIDSQRSIAVSKVLFGSYFAELDSDCNTSANTGNRSCKSNSTMARTATLTPGTYQIRYWYIARQQDGSVGSRVVCGAKDGDVSYYTKDGQTNRIEVFFEKKGNYNYNFANLVDVCVMSNEWTERVINVKVTTGDEYRFSWRAAGREDTYGGLIDNIRICRNYCPAA